MEKLVEPPSCLAAKALGGGGRDNRPNNPTARVNLINRSGKHHINQAHITKKSRMIDA